MSGQLLCVDIGNTTISFGVLGKKGEIGKVFDLSHSKCTCRALKNEIKGAAIDNVIICSVVPSMTPKVSTSLKRLFAAPVYILGKNISVPLVNRYLYPRQVGQDRLVNAYAVVRLYGAPAVCVDYGTAITFDVVSRKKEYLGGLIMPGLRISLQALADKTALLPEVRLLAPQNLVGRETAESMLAGVVYGAAGMTEALVKRLKEKIGKDAFVVLTGGNARLVHRYFKRVGRLDTHLTLKGLALVFKSYNSPDKRF